MKLRNLGQVIGEKLMEMRAKRLEALTAQKTIIVGYLNRSLTEAEIFSINCEIIANSAGWLGGNWTEKDIKLYYLKSNRKLFFDDEYQKYLDQISKENVKIKK